ncbi:MAG: Dam family site-specific DNA-(adenine-N6)-methyltransferase [Treponema sp.]|jgi:DNA adenine methylase|nr:Dam family site-specific DNA-(adenine-N6)-methyltransferase [Treponema sp.]
MDVLKPYLKWAGGKRQLLPEITENLPPEAGKYTYYEPFAGAGAVLFALRPEKAVINDRNTQLMISYQAVKNQVDALVVLLEEYQKNNSREFFYRIRNLDRNPGEFARLTCVEKAARFIFLNKTCYNGLYRVNAGGLFNVPYGRNKNPRICEAALLRRISAYLNSRDITLLNRDFEEAAGDAGENSFIYFDPPYYAEGRPGFTCYQADGFSAGDQERLRDVFAAAAERGAKCLLSNSDTGFIRDLYRGFSITAVSAKRAINSDAAGRGSVGEVLIRNY